MAQYTCFVCPTKDHLEYELDDLCLACGRKFGFPLENYPASIRDYVIVRALGRGYYGATFLATLGELQTQFVLKVSPAASYTYFEKDFKEECRIHDQVAKETEHVVPIMTMFDESIIFNGLSLLCHVAVLKFIDGETLDEILKAPTILARTAAQIGIDLFRIIEELRVKRVHHNDLHARNLIVERLKSGRRTDAIDSSVRLVAVDLGSVSDMSKSDSRTQRLGDLRWTASHLTGLASKLLYDPEKRSDIEYRLALVLDEIASAIENDVQKLRVPLTADYIRKMQDAFYQVSSPWKHPLQLWNFHDSYNAQTLEAWFVPHLLVDPEDRWLRSISAPGPQLVMGTSWRGFSLAGRGEILLRSEAIE